MCRWSVGLATCVVAAAALGLFADTPAARGIPVFAIDLRNRTSDGLLPFDEAFNVRATVAEEVTGGTLTVQEKSKGSCDAVVTGGKDLPGARITDTAAQPPRHLLLFSAPMLAPNKTYCFQFTLTKPVAESVATDFRRRLVMELDPKLRPLANQGLPPQVLTDLRDLGRATAIALANDSSAKLTVPAGSAFAQNATDADVKRAFDEVLTPILHHQDNRVHFLANYCSARAAVVRRLRQLQDPTSATQTVLEKLGQHTMTPEIDNVIATNRRAFQRLDSEDIATNIERDNDCKSDGTVDTLQDAWTTADVQAPLQQMATLQQQVQSVIEMMGMLRANDLQLGKVIGVSDANIQTAIAELTHARRIIQSAHADLESAEHHIEERATALDALAAKATLVAQNDVRITTTSVADYVTRAGWYISADVGVASAWEIRETFTYAGANFYFRPVNKQVPMGFLERNQFKRLSVMIGVSIDNVEQSGEYKGVLAGKALVGAVGYRLWESVKLSLGLAMMKEADPNPLVQDERNAVTPFGAVSIDWDVRGTIGKLGGVLGFN